ncbi:hotdog fold thioesterase [Zhihengliuella sp.]|uniref:PaaI family thioesterase n=1 Tax=Zhihengliuella sp. TaxID=1954483 RepID=UPI002810D925|nr:hotdog fold thioesterase [Zhihengliuella sp.]
MSIWFGEPTVEELNARHTGSLNEHLGIEVTELTEDSVHGRMPVDQRTTQPAGILHGGASVAFAESLASWGGYLTVDPARFHCVGQEINANHVRPGLPGTWVHGVATPLSRGRRSQVWDIRITDDAGRLVCVSRCTLAIVEAEPRR